MIKILKTLEFSKLILIVGYFTAIIFTAATGYLALVGGDAGSFANIVLAIWAMVSTAVGFYFWKAKAENMIKIGNSIPKKVMEEMERIKGFIE